MSNERETEGNRERHRAREKERDRERLIVFVCKCLLACVRARARVNMMQGRPDPCEHPLSTFIRAFLYVSKHAIHGCTFTSKRMDCVRMHAFIDPDRRSPPLLCSPIPGEQAAVVQQRVLQVDGALLVRGHGAPVVAPMQLSRGLQVGGGAL